jgi:hypothetical protein
MSENLIKPFFIVSGLYDAVLGLAFLIAPGAIFAMYAVEPPNHMAYVQFPALLLILFGIMFFRIAMNPVKNRDLILYGCGLKVSYCSMVFYYMATTGVPAMWIPWAYADLVFLALFVVAWRGLGQRAAAD